MKSNKYFEPGGHLLQYQPELKIKLNRVGEYPRPLDKDLTNLLDFYTSLPFKDGK